MKSSNKGETSRAMPVRPQLLTFSSFATVRSISL